MSTEAMRYARVVRETGSFSAAAKSCGVTQPALSNGIARLEDTLGGKLFDRSARGVTPTAFGESMLPRIERALEALDDVRAEATRLTAPTPGEIRVGVSPLIDPKLVVGAYRAVCGRPGEASQQLVLIEANMSELRESLVAGELDIIVVPSVEPMPHYEHRVIDSEPVMLVESRAATGPARLEELTGRQLILLPDTCGLTTFTNSLLKEYGITVRTYPGEAGSYRVLEEWSRLGLGSAMLPKSKLAEPDAPHREILDPEGRVVEVFYETVWDPRSTIAGELTALADRLVQPKP